MRRRRRAAAPRPPLQGIARAVWSAAYPDLPWPAGWRVEWAGFMRGVVGLTIWRERRVLLSWSDATSPRPTWMEGTWDRPACPVETLVHELIHVRWGASLKHGRDFTRLERAALQRVWEVAK